MLNLRDVPVIELSQLSQVQFTENHKLINSDDRRACRANLDKAAVLANSDDHHTRIVFSTMDGYKQLKCNVLSVSQGGVSIENGPVIPLAAIYNVEITR